jgi:hypothetical protein
VRGKVKTACIACKFFSNKNTYIYENRVVVTNGPDDTIKSTGKIEMGRNKKILM